MASDDVAAWYIPHFGVDHPQKRKIRVVFDCSTKFFGTSLNDNLMQGPDLTSSLVGVFTRFHQEKIVAIGDIESMFYQVKVPEYQRKYLRYDWWPDGDLDVEVIEYEMCSRFYIFITKMFELCTRENCQRQL